MYLSKQNLFKTRSTQKELLDTEYVSDEELKRNLKEFKIINQYLGTKTSLYSALNKIYTLRYSFKINSPLKIADMGCGAGDLAYQIYLWTKKNKIPAKIMGFDINPEIIAYAKNSNKDCPELEFQILDLNNIKENPKEFDIICLNNVCHHFDDDELIQLLRNLYANTKSAIIINDLQRQPLSYYAAKILTKLFRLSNLAQHDGPLSVLRAFQYTELVKIIAAIKPQRYEIHKNWLKRWQAIIWKNYPETQITR